MKYPGFQYIYYDCLHRQHLKHNHPDLIARYNGFNTPQDIFARLIDVSDVPRRTYYLTYVNQHKTLYRISSGLEVSQNSSSKIWGLFVDRWRDKDGAYYWEYENRLLGLDELPESRNFLALKEILLATDD